MNFIMILLSILAFVFIMGLVVLIHEFGHFIFAKRAGILCHEFAIGMGPVIYSKKKGETTYMIKAIPIGGYVSMAGEEIEAELVKVGNNIGINLKDGCVCEFILKEGIDSQIIGEIKEIDIQGKNNEQLYVVINSDGIEKRYPVLRDAFYVLDSKRKIQIAPYDRSFESKTIFERFLTIFFGPFMNFVLAIFIYLIYWCAIGVPNYNSTVIGEVSNDYPASQVVQVNDKIISINGVTINSWSDSKNSLSSIMDSLALEGTTQINMVVERDGKQKTLDTINNYIVINSVGLSNIQISENAKWPDSSNKVGAMVGNVAFNYVSNTQKNEKLLSNGDIITGVCIQRVSKIDGKNIFDNNTKYLEVKSWKDLVLILKDEDVCKVYFEFYDQESKQIEKTQTAIESYGNEVLDNQRIEKVSISIGISPVMKFNVGGIFKNTFKSFWNDFTLIFRTLKLLIAPSGVRQVGVSNLSGFVGIFSMINRYLNAGFLPLLGFTALLSVNLGVMNLLPIPAFDATEGKV